MPNSLDHPLPDIPIENHGSLYLLRPASASGREWLDAYIQSDALTFSNAVVCEPRYVSNIVFGAQSDGPEVA
jgi:hypothetical protein